MTVLSPWDALAEGYDGAYTQPRDLADDDELLTQIHHVLGPEHRVIDAGCGTGWLLDHYPSFAAYLGVDQSPRMLNLAHTKHNNAVFMLGDLNETETLDRLQEMNRVYHFDRLVSLNGSPNWIRTWPELRRRLPGIPFLLGFMGKGHDSQRITWARTNGVATPLATYAELRDLFPDATITSYGGLLSPLLSSYRSLRVVLKLERVVYDRLNLLFRDRALWHLVLDGCSV